MIDFTNVKQGSMSRFNPGVQYQAGKKDTAYTSVLGRTDIGSLNNTDQVKISNDAALKNKLRAYSSAMAKEIITVPQDKIARLKEQYVGDACPTCGADVAKAIFSKLGVGGSDDE